jgi:hypothetical protein
MDVCVVNKDKKAKRWAIKTETQVRMKYKMNTREYNKKIPPVAWMFELCCKNTEKVKNVGQTRQRTSYEVQNTSEYKKNPAVTTIF